MDIQAIIIAAVVVGGVGIVIGIILGIAGEKFKVEVDGIRPPLNSIPGLGTVAAQGIQEARQEGEFMSIDDMKIRAKVGKSTIEMLEKAGCLEGMSQSNQMSLFA